MSRANSVIWKTVVAAMIAGCGGKATTPSPAMPEPAPTPVVAAPDTTVPPPAPPPEPEAPPAPPEPAPPPEPATITVRVMSTPAGADVYMDGKLVGKTPVEVQLPQHSADVNLKVMRAGYDDKELVVKAESDQTLEVALGKKVAKKKRPRGVGTIGHGSGTGSGRSEGRGFILS
jgi:hypothetical protein